MPFNGYIPWASSRLCRLSNGALWHWWRVPQPSPQHASGIVSECFGRRYAFFGSHHHSCCWSTNIKGQHASNKYKIKTVRNHANFAVPMPRWCERSAHHKGQCACLHGNPFFDVSHQAFAIPIPTIPESSGQHVFRQMSIGDNTLGRVGLCSWMRSLRRNCVTSLSCTEGWWTWKFCFQEGPWSRRKCETLVRIALMSHPQNALVFFFPWFCAPNELALHSWAPQRKSTCGRKPATCLRAWDMANAGQHCWVFELMVMKVQW